MKQGSIFEQSLEFNSPLASRMRPKTLADFVGQEHLIGEGMFLREMIDRDNISSMIFWGPPGVGKTTLAEIIANKTESKFITFSAVMNGIKEIKEIMKKAEENRQYGERTIVFIDEIHRFNKAQQDAFLPFVEQGSIILIGATTENPSFEVNSALLSRMKVFVLQQLTQENIVQLLKKAVDNKRAFSNLKIEVHENLLRKIAIFSNGDARNALNTLEILVMNSKRKENQITISQNLLEQLLKDKVSYYDKKGEDHYNIISAFHKSIRNSDVDSAIYWLSRMIDSGENPLYIARRLVRIASEDIGLADNNALNLAINTFQACQFLGLPECDVHLIQCAIYLSLAPKSNATEVARILSKKDIKDTINEPVPLHLRNAQTKLMEEVGYGKGYEYAHHYPYKMTAMPTMPEKLGDRQYYFPSDQGNEKKIKERYEQIKLWKRDNRHHQKN